VRRARYAAAVLLLLLLLLVVLMIPTLLRQVTNAFLFHPMSGQSRAPDAVGLTFEEVTLVAEDGVRTQAWWIPWGGDPAEALVVSVVTFHGNAGTMADRLEHTRLLHDLGVSVLTAEYRGYGDSEGSPTEEGLAADARAALSELRRRAPSDRVVVHGRSLGGAVAARLASDVAVDGLVVESTFTTLRDMAGRSGIPLASHLIAYEFDSLARVRELQTPLLIVHGQADELIPVDMGRQLRDAAGGPVELLEVPGGTHNDTWVRGGSTYWNRLGAWLKTVAHRSPR
jgi:uncharacterized protein